MVPPGKARCWTNFLGKPNRHPRLLDCGAAERRWRPTAEIVDQLCHLRYDQFKPIVVDGVACVAGDDTPTQRRKCFQPFLFLVPHALCLDPLGGCLLLVWVPRDHQQRHHAEAFEPPGWIAERCEIDELDVVTADVC